ncbi:uncharacterized protein PHACADRAFT_257451, partial [Phanerochaete carnosa HHB-10118-sp]
MSKLLPQVSPLVLSSLGRHLRQAELISFPESVYGESKIVCAPPWIESRIPALLRPLRKLVSLTMIYVQFKSLTQLLNIIRSLPQIRDLHLKRVEILQAPRHFFWPPSVVLTELQIFRLEECRVPTHVIPALISLGIQGKPSFISSPATPSRHLRQLNGILLHYDD